MTNFIPIFPLEIVVFPGEFLNLHISEARYQQLVKDCLAQKKPFGIPVVIEEKVMEFGTLLHIEEVSHMYESGKMDIKTQAGDIFRVLEIIPTVPEKQYSGAIVNYPENSADGSKSAMRSLVSQAKLVLKRLGIQKSLLKTSGDISTYDIAHFAGLGLQQEYEFLQLTTERQRQAYLKRHFLEILPTVTALHLLKERVQMNGHFRHLKSY
jgi:Lon protease-like protein